MTIDEAIARAINKSLGEDNEIAVFRAELRRLGFSIRRLHINDPIL